MNKSLTKEQKENLLNISQKQIKSDSEWMKTIIASFSAFLGLMISLHTEPSKTEYLHLIYSSIICIVGLGILSGVIYLFSESNTTSRLRDNYFDAISKSLNEKTDDIIVSPYKFFFLMFWISCISFFVSIPLVIYYSVILDSIK